MIQTRDPIPALKEQLRRKIIALVGDWDQQVTAKRLGTDQPRMSDLRGGRLNRFSLEKLILFLTNLEQQVAITVTGDKPRRFRFPPRPARIPSKEGMSQVGTLMAILP
jgi:predicted XRE-type DNA-binding protein